MKISQTGVLPPSEMFFHTESEFARNALYYLVVAGEYWCNKDYLIERKTFNSYLILFVHSGKMKIKYNNQQYSAEKNDLVFLNCHRSHSYSTEGEDVHFEYFHFDGVSAAEYFDLLYNQNNVVFHIENSMIIPNYINQIVKLARGKKVDEHFISKNDEHFISKNIHTILYELVQITSKEISNHQIQHVISYIENHFQQELTLEELAESMNISTYHLVRLFKKYTGKSPYQYILDYRIHHAKTLLQTTDDSIETVAFNSGFNSISHFVTTFKKRTNYTPLQFRKLNF